MGQHYEITVSVWDFNDVQRDALLDRIGEAVCPSENHDEFCPVEWLVSGRLVDDEE